MWKMVVNTDFVIGNAGVVMNVNKIKFRAEMVGMSVPSPEGGMSLYVYLGGTVIADKSAGVYIGNNVWEFSPVIKDNVVKGFFAKNTRGKACLHFIENGGREWLRNLTLVGDALQ